jgi:hypothetical protein
MESRYPGAPIGHSIKGCGRLRPATELPLPLDILQKQDRTRIIYSQAITEDGFICRKTELFGQTRFTLLGTERRDSKQRDGQSQLGSVGSIHVRITLPLVCAELSRDEPS